MKSFLKFTILPSFVVLLAASWAAHADDGLTCPAIFTKKPESNVVVLGLKRATPRTPVTPSERQVRDRILKTEDAFETLGVPDGADTAAAEAAATWLLRRFDPLKAEGDEELVAITNRIVAARKKIREGGRRLLPLKETKKDPGYENAKDETDTAFGPFGARKTHADYPLALAGEQIQISPEEVRGLNVAQLSDALPKTEAKWLPKKWSKWLSDKADSRRPKKYKRVKQNVELVIMTYKVKEFQNHVEELVVRDGRLINAATQKPFDSGTILPAMYVMKADGRIFAYRFDQPRAPRSKSSAHNMFATPEDNGGLHYGSGEPFATAGEMVVKDGRLVTINNDAPFYEKSLPHFKQVLKELDEQGLNLAPVQIFSVRHRDLSDAIRDARRAHGMDPNDPKK